MDSNFEITKFSPFGIISLEEIQISVPFIPDNLKQQSSQTPSQKHAENPENPKHNQTPPREKLSKSRNSRFIEKNPRRRRKRFNYLTAGETSHRNDHLPRSSSLPKPYKLPLRRLFLLQSTYITSSPPIRRKYLEESRTLTGATDTLRPRPINTEPT